MRDLPPPCRGNMLPCTAMVISGVPSHTQFRTLPARTDVTGPDAKDRTHNRFVNRIGPHQRPDMDSSGKVHRRTHGDFHPQGTVARAWATANGAGRPCANGFTAARPATHRSAAPAQQQSAQGGNRRAPAGRAVPRAAAAVAGRARTLHEAGGRHQDYRQAIRRPPAQVPAARERGHRRGRSAKKLR